MCNCNERVNEKLKEKNARLAFSFCLSSDLSEADAMLMIQTEKVNKAYRGKIPTVIPTFCPFCGVKYVRKDDPATEEVAA
jgi:hypothetical protein